MPAALWGGRDRKTLLRTDTLRDGGRGWCRGNSQLGFRPLQGPRLGAPTDTPSAAFPASRPAWGPSLLGEEALSPILPQTPLTCPWSGRHLPRGG